jgi:hypothetical protein
MKISIVGVVLITIMVSALLIGSELHKNDESLNITQNIYSFTSNITWNITNQQIQQKFNEQNTNVPLMQSTRISNVIYKLVDAGGYSVMEFMKFFIELGYNHPDYDFRMILELCRIYIYFLILCVFIPVIIPLIAIGYLIIAGIIKIIKYLFKKV